MPEAIITKTCTKCKVEKPIAEFPKSKKSPCRKCRYILWKAWTRTEKGRAVLKAWRKSPKGRALVKRNSPQRKAYQSSPKMKAWKSNWSRGRKSTIETQRKHLKDILNNPVKRVRYKARQFLRQAVLSGKLVRPDFCSRCGLICHAHGHHKSYEQDRWLDVEWLCVSCHRIAHGKEPALYLRLAKTLSQSASQSGLSSPQQD